MEGRDWDQPLFPKARCLLHVVGVGIPIALPIRQSLVDVALLDKTVHVFLWRLSHPYKKKHLHFPDIDTFPNTVLRTREDRHIPKITCLLSSSINLFYTNGS